MLGSECVDLHEKCAPNPSRDGCRQWSSAKLMPHQSQIATAPREDQKIRHRACTLQRVWANAPVLHTYVSARFEIRSFEVLILVSEGPPSFSVANLANPLQTVANRLYRHATAPYGTLQPGAAQERPRSSPGAARSGPAAARGCQEPPGAAQ